MSASEAKPKILYVITKSNWGGAQRYVHDLALSMPAEGFEVAVALGGTGEPGAPPGKLHDLLSRSGVRTVHLQHVARDIFVLKELQAVRELVHLFKRERPDIVHLNSSKAGLLGALAARIAGVAVIVFTAHGWPWRETHRSFLWQATAWLGSWITILLSHHVITVSEFDRTEGMTLPLASEKLITIHNGHNPQTLEEKSYARSVLLPHARMLSQFWIGTIGELHPNKGIDIAIRAVGDLYRKGIGVTYVVIGDGAARASLEKLIESEDLRSCVHLVGFKPGASALLSAFDVFALPDRKTGFPYVLLEAGSAGIPTVATGVGGIPEIIIGGVSGILVPPEDPLAFAGALRALLSDNDRRTAFGAALKKSVVTEFKLTRMVEETSALYRAARSLRA